MKHKLPLLLIAGALFQCSTILAVDLKYTPHDPVDISEHTAVLAPANPAAGGEALYQGRVRVYLIEPSSRWQDLYGTFFTNAVLDIPIQENIELNDGDVEYFTVAWDVAPTGWELITHDNIKAVAAVSKAAAVSKDASPPDGYYFNSHTVDACAEAVPGTIGWGETAPGFTHRVFVEESSAYG